MDTIKIFYTDKFGREIAYRCTDLEFKDFIYDFLEDHINTGLQLSIEKLDKSTDTRYTKQIDYYNLNLKDLW